MHWQKLASIETSNELVETEVEPWKLQTVSWKWKDMLACRQSFPTSEA